MAVLAHPRPPRNAVLRRPRAAPRDGKHATGKTLPPARFADSPNDPALASAVCQRPVWSTKGRSIAGPVRCGSCVHGLRFAKRTGTSKLREDATLVVTHGD